MAWNDRQRGWSAGSSHAASTRGRNGKVIEAALEHAGYLRECALGDDDYGARATMEEAERWERGRGMNWRTYCRRAAISLAASVLNSSAALSIASRSSVASTLPSLMALAAAR
jgi:hypothetical protein